MGNQNAQASRFKLPKRGDILTALVSLLFTFFLLEIVAQIWYNNFASKEQLEKYGLYDQVPEKAWQMKRHHYLNYALNPDYKKGMVRHNTFGYRGGEIILPKPDSVFRIVCLGGSTTYSVYIGDDAKAYPFLLEKLLKKEYGYRNIEVINAGVPGYNSWESLINLEFKVLDLAPDMIIIYHGTNDVHPRLIPPNLYVGDNSGRRQQWEYPKTAIYDQSALLRFLRRHMGITSQIGLESLITPAYEEGPVENFQNQDILEQNPPVFFERNLKSMIAIAQINGIQPMLATWAYCPHKGDYAGTAHYRQGFREGNEIMRALGTEYNIPVFDFAKAMPQDAKYWEDGRHVNYDGVALKSKLFAEFIHQNRLIDSLHYTNQTSAK